MTPVLELQDLHVLLCTHRHQGVELVKGVSFSVYPGECLGILGKSRERGCWGEVMKNCAV